MRVFIALSLIAATALVPAQGHGPQFQPPYSVAKQLHRRSVETSKPDAATGASSAASTNEAASFSNSRTAAALVESATAQTSGVIDAPCPEANAVCGYVRVPLDRRHLDGEKNSIYFEIYPHTSPGPATSAILMNLGGLASQQRFTGTMHSPCSPPISTRTTSC